MTSAVPAPSAATALRLLNLSRAGCCMAAMVYAGALPFLRPAWGMDAATAGSVQAAYNIANALALLAASWLADRFGAKRIYLIAAWSGALAMLLFAACARSYGSALVLAPLLAATQGGAYTPALMLVTELVPPRRRGAAIGGMLAAGSFGYVLSVSGALGGAALLDYRWGFALCAIGPLAGAVCGSLGLRGHENRTAAHSRGEQAGGLWVSLITPTSVLLTLGYTAHCWELLGSWAWMPSFLNSALAGLNLSPILSGLIVACTIHLAGMLSTVAAGAASDRWGRPWVLFTVALTGAVLSLLLGWSIHWGAAPALLLAFAASFFILGDSGVLSAAMTEAVPPRHLGTALAVRSVLGFGAGSLSPVLFGAALDVTGQWGWAFAVLGGGGLLATLAAAFLLKASRVRPAVPTSA